MAKQDLVDECVENKEIGTIVVSGMSAAMVADLAAIASAGNPGAVTIASTAAYEATQHSMENGGWEAGCEAMASGATALGDAYQAAGDAVDDLFGGPAQEGLPAGPGEAEPGVDVPDFAESSFGKEGEDVNPFADATQDWIPAEPPLEAEAPWNETTPEASVTLFEESTTSPAWDALGPAVQDPWMPGEDFSGPGSEPAPDPVADEYPPAAAEEPSAWDAAGPGFSSWDAGSSGGATESWDAGSSSGDGGYSGSDGGGGSSD